MLVQHIDAIVTCDDQDRVLYDAWLQTEGPRITGMGCHSKGAPPSAPPPAPPADGELLDGRGMWMYPGLVNTHHHLYQCFTRNLPAVQNMELFPWLLYLYEIWKNIDRDVIRYSTLAGAGELLKYGCTTVFDHHYVFPRSAPGDLIDTQFAAAAELGVRMHCSRGSMSLSKKDGGLPPDSVVQDVGEILADSERLIRAYHNTGEYAMRQVVLAPCSPFSVTAELLRESAALARQYGVRLHTHLCETKDEEAFTLEKTGLRPFAYMESLGWVGADVFYAHGIHFNGEELRALADTQTGVAHCPCSNMKLASGVARVPEMLALGVPLGLAVDGAASNDASNLMEEMRVAYLLHRLTAGANTGTTAPTGYDILKMATVGGARLLGRRDIGHLAVGMAADCFMIGNRGLELTGAGGDPMSFFGTVGYHQPVDYAFVNGKMAVKSGKLTMIDEEEAAAKGREAVKRLLHK